VSRFFDENLRNSYINAASDKASKQASARARAHTHTYTHTNSPLLIQPAFQY